MLHNSVFLLIEAQRKICDELFDLIEAQRNFRKSGRGFSEQV